MILNRGPVPANRRRGLGVSERSVGPSDAPEEHLRCERYIHHFACGRKTVASWDYISDFFSNLLQVAGKVISTAVRFPLNAVLG